MIRDEVFVTEMQALADRFNRTASDTLIRRYYEFLTTTLTTEQFQAAARVIYTHDQFWPAPVRFLEAAGVDPKSEAEAAWDLALSEATKGIAQPLDAYTPAHAAALLAVGKNRAIGLTREDQLPFLKRDFIAAYIQHAERASNPQLEKPRTPAITEVLT